MLNLFDHKELVGRNCRGWRKPPIDPEKLEIVQCFCFKLYPSDMAGTNKWKNCTSAIDEMLRHGARTKQHYTNRVLNIQNPL